MAALERNYTIERGIQWSREITIYDQPNHPLDLTDATIAGQIRLSEAPTDIRAALTGTNPIITTFDVAVATPNTGVFILSLTGAKSLLFEPGDYEYDVIITFQSGDKRRILKGILTFVATVTHA